MDDRYIDKLRTNHSWLKETIRSYHITGYLRMRNILTERDLDRINSKITEEERTEELLFILAGKDDNWAYKALPRSLRVKQDGLRLYDDVADLLDGADAERGIHPDDEEGWNHVQEIRGKIAERLDPEEACKHLVNSRFLTEQESDAIKEEDTPFERANSLLRVLPTKGRNAFSVLCRLLYRQGLGNFAPRFLKPVTNIDQQVSYFFQSNDATKVKQAVLGSQATITVVSGVGGTGKTQISLWVAFQVLHLHPNAVIWRMDGQNRQTFLASKKRLLEALDAEVPEDNSRMDEYLDEALRKRDTPVLLIVEDITDRSLLTSAFLKERSQYSVMLLTKEENLQLPEEAPFPSFVQLDGFQTGEGIRFLQTNLSKPDIPIDQLQCLTDVFEGSPLGLAAAFQYMQDTSTSPEQYMLLLKKDQSARKLQKGAERMMTPHYTKFSGRGLHPAFQQAHNNVRAPGDAPDTDEDSDSEEDAPHTDEDRENVQDGEDGSQSQQSGQEEASHSPDDHDTEDVAVLTTSSWDSCFPARCVTSEVDGSELVGAVGGISSPPRSQASSPTGSLRAVASSPPPGFHHDSRRAVQVQPATRVMCQLLHLQEPIIQQHIDEDMSPYGPPALTVIQNQELPVMPVESSDQSTLEQLSGTVLVYCHPSEQLIATERSHPQQFLWQVAGRVVREVFDIDIGILLESSYTFRYYAPSRPPDSLRFVPVHATVGTGTTAVQAVAAADSLRWAWRLTLTQAGQDSQLYLEIRHAGGIQRMAIFVEHAGPNLDHMPCRNPSLQQNSSSIVVSLEAERERLQMLIGQGSIAVRVQRGDRAQIIKEIVSLYLQSPSAAGCRLNVQFVGESAIDYGGPGRELFMLAWRWLSKRYLENGIPRQSPDLEPDTYGFWLAIGMFTFHMFVMYNCFPAVHLSRFVVETLFNGPQQLDCVNWLTTFLDTLRGNERILLMESSCNEAAFERNRVELTAMLMTWGVSTFPRSPAHLTRMVPGIGRHVCLDSHYVALCGFVNGFREGWRGRVRPGDIDRLINQARHPTSYQDIIQALRIDSSNVDSHTGSRLIRYLGQWLHNASPTELQELLFTATGCDQLTGNVITIVFFDPVYPNDAIRISTCDQILPVQVVETYEDFCTYMIGVLSDSDNTFNTV